MSLIQNNRYTVVGASRGEIFLYIFYFCVAIILMRFFYLQIIEGNEYTVKSLGNSERKYSIIPARGLIYDRNGVLIAKNRDSFSLSLVGGYTPRDKKKRTLLFEDIQKHFSISVKFLEKKYQAFKNSYSEIMVKELLSTKEVIYFSEHEARYSSLNLVEYSGRIYPFEESLSHVLGYIGAISQKQYNKDKATYRRSQIVGKAGLEKQYNKVLTGKDGQYYVGVNSLGRKIDENLTREFKPIPGKNLEVSIDSQLQEIAYHALKNQTGVVIVTKVSTGEVLALASSPGFASNQFMKEDSNTFLWKLLNNKKRPLINRSTQGRYSPGSIFKIVVALAGLEDNAFNPKTVVDTSKGYFKLGNQIFRDHGVKLSANLAQAIIHSNNVYFYKLGVQLGYASILAYSIKLGLNQKTGIDLPNEKSSFVPTPEWKEKRFHNVWVDGDTVNVSIGQGFLIFTPLGVHNIISTIATGKVIRPRIVWKIRNPYSGVVEKQFNTELITDFQPKRRTLREIRKGVFGVPYFGTGKWHQYLSKVRIAGKTGTVQNSSGKDHAWFTSYGPVDKSVNEQYAITVLVEHGGFGSGVTPITATLYNYLEGYQTKAEAMRTLDRLIPAIKHPQ